ncbi:MAG: hypothetical protein JJ863_25495 [Deltaproteobacteria bacterium]|nr:hypothetical protein [Deltaproteobacteria bacterium]
MLPRLVRFCALLLLACGPTLSGGPGGGRVELPDDRPPPPAEDAPDSLPQIASTAEWDTLAYRPADATMAHTEVVKIVVDLEEDWRTYFVQSARWPLHFYFVQRFIDRFADHGAFNVQQYRRPDRRFILASIVRYLDADVWSIELVPGDTLSAERLGRLLAHLKERVFFGEDLRFRPLSPGHEERARTAGVPTVDETRLQAAQRYQAVVLGVTHGYLRIARDDESVMNARPNDIVVVDQIPEDLPPIAGLITARLQAPLAHVAVLSRSRGTPDMALRDATNDSRLTALEGELVRLTVGAQAMQIERSTLEAAQAQWDALRPPNAYTPPIRQPTPPVLVQLCDTGVDDADVVGAKAAQLGALCRAGGIETPGGFVAPFGAFLQHRREAGIDRAAIARVVGTEDRAERRAALEGLRAAIERTRVSPALLRQVRAKLAPGRPHIFRSSTNAEDLEGFSGAGLYRSVVVDPGADDATLADALRRVWASVYLERAWEERAWARIEQDAVAMAVLIQPFVDDIVATGVAVTANPFTQVRPGVYVNLQTRSEGVTAAEGDELPEQLLIYTWTETPEVFVLGRSSRTEGRAILRGDEHARLARLLQQIHQRLTPVYEGEANAVDVEVLLTRDRRFVIVQARPITIRYGPGQRWND